MRTHQAQLFHIHPVNPQLRLIRQVAQALQAGGVVAMPTDSCYALLAHIDNAPAAQSLRQIRQLEQGHHFTLLCRNLSEISDMARVDNAQYRLLKSATPGPWTFILEATRELPRRLSHPSRKTVGIRVPDHPVTLALLEELGVPVVSTSLIPADENQPLNDPEEIYTRYKHLLSIVVDSGACSNEVTTVIDLSAQPPQVLRRGLGDPILLGLKYC